MKLKRTFSFGQSNVIEITKHFDDYHTINAPDLFEILLLIINDCVVDISIKAFGEFLEESFDMYQRIMS
jgi:hypothetical protein